jgi:hypothetical protein
LARTSNRPFHEVMQYFAMERFLYRLSSSPHRSRFILKGALMLHVWDAPLARATRDLDFLGRTDNSLENVERLVREVCAIEVEPDGMVFDPATVKGERIKEDADYQGVRIRFSGLLGKARVPMQLDVGFGDVIRPCIGGCRPARSRRAMAPRGRASRPCSFRSSTRRRRQRRPHPNTSTSSFAIRSPFAFPTASTPTSSAASSLCCVNRADAPAYGPRLPRRRRDRPAKVV